MDKREVNERNFLSDGNHLSVYNQPVKAAPRDDGEVIDDSQFTIHARDQAMNTWRHMADSSNAKHLCVYLPIKSSPKKTSKTSSN